jgi:hypothetical protein
MRKRIDYKKKYLQMKGGMDVFIMLFYMVMLACWKLLEFMAQPYMTIEIARMSGFMEAIILMLMLTWLGFVLEDCFKLWKYERRKAKHGNKKN